MSPPRTGLWLVGSGIFLCLLATALNGCSSLGYYGQAVAGQWQLLQARRPITQVLTDPQVPESTRERLQLAQQMRRYGIYVLALPDNGSYHSYADLQRPYVVWNVVATPPFSLQPLQNCFPVVGCLNYRGYFQKSDAVKRADYLRQRGYDVDVSGATAFSSLGWFNDPLLNTMLRWDIPQLAGVIFHEMAHAKLYVPDDTAFNEAFANTVQQIGTLRWLKAQRPDLLDDYRQDKARQQDFLQLVGAARQQLETLYALGLKNPQDLRRAKAEVFAQLQRNYQQLKQQRWQGYSGYDNWFAHDLNNAKLALLGTYAGWVPALRALYRHHGSNLPAFYTACTALGKLPEAQREAKLASIQAGCSALDQGACAALMAEDAGG